MKTERELFIVAAKKLGINTELVDTPMGLMFKYGSTRDSFDIWIASANREGYKLVPLQPPNEVIVAIEKKVENQLEASGINQDPFRLDGETIYEAMIGGAE